MALVEDQDFTLLLSGEIGSELLQLSAPELLINASIVNGEDRQSYTSNPIQGKHYDDDFTGYQQSDLSMKSVRAYHWEVRAGAPRLTDLEQYYRSKRNQPIEGTGRPLWVDSKVPEGTRIHFAPANPYWHHTFAAIVLGSSEDSHGSIEPRSLVKSSPSILWDDVSVTRVWCKRYPGWLSWKQDGKHSLKKGSAMIDLSLRIILEPTGYGTSDRAVSRL